MTVGGSGAKKAGKGRGNETTREVRPDRHDNLVEPYIGVAQHDTATDSSLNLDHDSWIPTGLGGKRHVARDLCRYFCLAKRTIARFGYGWERNLLLVRVAFPVEGA